MKRSVVTLLASLPVALSLSAVQAGPAAARPHGHRLYAFVGTVTAVDTASDSVSVDVLRSLPASLVPADSSSATFAVGPHTLVLGGNPSPGGGDPVAHAAEHGLTKGSLSGVAVGDLVAGAEVGVAGETLAQVEATPLMVLIDLPAPASSSSSPGATTSATTSTAEAGKALRKALVLLSHRVSKARHHKRHGAPV